jgi:transposase
MAIGEVQRMADESQEQPTREELIEARERLEEQLGILKNPIRSWDRNPVLIAKIQGMIDDINESLADLEPRDATIPGKSS